jgi:phage shock protein C
MFCSKCGNQVDPSSRFCPACGATVNASAPPPPPGAYPNPGQLNRPLNGRMIGGVCAGFALHYGWDLNLTRIITALLIICTGVGALAYIAAWIIIPQEPYPVLPKSI